ncbi:uncharacterized protein LOC129725767 [Wyeomyia smithii]|uniref:uncharacterized protein LOC129725767 n=1 Tax=Wyeomyia smithii TaxID=174621 RepID=UPI002467C750|nr:uncharacterized protein LOC129725767 [Wyeomyia smithii]
MIVSIPSVDVIGPFLKIRDIGTKVGIEMVIGHFHQETDTIRKDRTSVNLLLSVHFVARKVTPKKYCYKLKGKSPHKNYRSVKFVDSPKPSTSSTSYLFKRFNEEIKNKSHADSESEEDESMKCMLISSINKINEPCYVEATIEKKRLTMEVDCGSAETDISEDLFLRNFENVTVEGCNKKLVVIDGKKLKVLGKAKVDVRLGSSTKHLYMIILRCENDFIPLMGRTWLDVFYYGWRNTFSRPIIQQKQVNTLKDDNVIEVIKNFPRWPDHIRP